MTAVVGMFQEDPPTLCDRGTGEQAEIGRLVVASVTRAQVDESDLAHGGLVLKNLAFGGPSQADELP